MSSANEVVESQQFLEPDFDANKLTKPQLRSILSQHGVNDLPPLSAKKEALVTLFDSRIKPRAEDIKAAQSKIKPSSHGIVMLDKDSRPSPSKSSPNKSSSPRNLPRGRRGTSSSEKRNSRSVSRQRSSSRQPKAEDSPLTLSRKALPRNADSPVSARVKLRERITTLNQMLASKAAEPKRKNASIVLKVMRDALSMLVFFLVVAVGAFYIRWKYIHPFPYCNNGVHHWNWIPKDWQALDSWMELLQTNCVSCPHHASCFDGRLNCNDGYVKSSNMLAFGSSCVPDKKKLWVLDRIAQAIYKELQNRGGKAACTGIDDERYLKINSAYKQKLGSTFASELQTENADAMIKHAIDDLVKSSAYGVSSATDALGERVYWLQHPHVPLSCRFKNVLNTLWLRYRTTFLYFIISSTILVLLVSFVKWKLFYWARTDEMSMIIYQMLAENAGLHKRDCTVPAAIPVDQIRDALLMTDKSMASRQIFNLLWPEVVRKVASNANVTETELHTRGGSVNQWEWIGMDLFQKKSIVEVDYDDHDGEDSTSSIASPLARQRHMYPRL